MAQGSIFVHFKTKNSLLFYIINFDLVKFEEELGEKCSPKLDSETFLGVLLDAIGNNENMLSRVYKDYHYLPENITKRVDHVDSLIKTLLFDNLRANPGKSLSIVDSFISIDAFISQIKQNLLDKDVYTEFNSIIRQRRGKLVKLYRTLFE